MSELDIIVPVYNSELYLDKCIESILSQTFDDFSLILVDDGSTDHSGNICDLWEKKDHRIKAFHQKNLGAMSAWKYGISKSDSNYIGFVDSDDWVDNNMFLTLLKTIKHYDADLVTCNIKKDNDFGKDINKSIDYKFYDTEQKRSILYPRLISGGNYKNRGISPNRVSKVIKRDIIEQSLKYCIDDVTIGEDFLATFCFAQLSSSIVVIDNYYPYCYRVHDNSVTTKYSSDRFAKVNVLRKYMLNANKIDQYDFTYQINTDYIKMMLMELDTEILYSGKTNNEIFSVMQNLYISKDFQNALQHSETDKLPIKYKLYLTFMKHHLYQMAVIMRRIKK